MSDFEFRTLPATTGLLQELIGQGQKRLDLLLHALQLAEALGAVVVFFAGQGTIGQVSFQRGRDSI